MENTAAEKRLNFLFLLLIVTVSTVLILKNYTPGVYLLGWDSLHSEFNFIESLKRMFFGVFRPEQGLGVVAAHSHMADWPRVLFLLFESIFMPLSFLRYSFVFLCLVLGPLGIYSFLKYVLKIDHNTSWIFPASFLGALAYLLNLGTVQNFFVPFEMFITAFAFLPWLFLTTSRYLKEGGGKNMLLFSLVFILASPMAYAATLWYASVGGLVVFLFGFALFLDSKKVAFKRLFFVLLLGFTLNSYWILPNIYSIKEQSAVIANSKINQLFSAEAFMRNQDYGTINNILLQKNFLFSWRNFDFESNKFVNLLGYWNSYLSIPMVVIAGYLIGIVGVLGVFTGIVGKKRIAMVFLPLLVYTLFFLINVNPPTGTIYSFFYNNFGIFREGFRMPFTKFSILYEFVFSVYLALFSFWLFNLRHKLFQPLKFLFLGGLTLSILYFNLPMFQGYLIGKNVQNNLPDNYIKAYEFLNNKTGRIAKLPFNSLYNWEFHSWGLEGSGWFTWFLSKNSQMDRDFDRWGAENENFYTQSSNALYSNDNDGFVKSLQKYQIKYLFLDESVINPGQDIKSMGYDELKVKISEIPEIKKVAQFGFISIYETPFGAIANDIYVPKTVTKSGTNLGYSGYDPIYRTYGDYIYDQDAQSNPFISFDPRNKIEIDIEQNNQDPVATITFTSGQHKYSTKSVDVAKENLSVNRGFIKPYNCDIYGDGTVEKQNTFRGILYKAENGGVSCDYLGYPDLKYNQAYVLRIVGENISGRPLKIYLFNFETGRAEIEQIVAKGDFDETYIIYPKQNPATNDSELSNIGGYSLNFETRSFGRITSENLLSKVEIYPVDYKSISEFKTSDSEPVVLANGLEIVKTTKINPVLYKVDVQRGGILQLSIGYDDGWVAFASGQDNWEFSLLNHIKINSWANGWIVPEGGMSTIYIFFWPQLLEWLGFVLALTSLVYIFKNRK